MLGSDLPCRQHGEVHQVNTSILTEIVSKESANIGDTAIYLVLIAERFFRNVTAAKPVLSKVEGTGLYSSKNWIPTTRFRSHKLRRNDKCCFYNRN